MSLNFSNTIRWTVISACAIIFVVSSPGVAFARDGADDSRKSTTSSSSSSESSSGGGSGTSSFCLKVSSETGEVRTNVANAAAKLQAAWTAQQQRQTTRWQEVDARVVQARAKADAARAENFTALQAKATTDEQKSAVQTYQSAVLSAVAARRASYDTARQAYRSGVVAAVQARHDAVLAQLNLLTSSVNTATSEAQAKCAANPKEGNSARSSLQSSLKTSRQKFQSDRSQDEKVRTQVKQLAETRNAAFRAADQSFKTSMAAAAKALQAVFESTAI